MSAAIHHREVPPAVRRVLDAVRRRIRAYVLAEGMGLVLALLGTAFWAGLLLDWLFEPSGRVRMLAILAVAGATAWLAYRCLIRRLIVPISDSSAALLLERRFPLLGEHVQTAVDLAAAHEESKAYDAALVEQTRQAAAQAVAGVRPNELFNRWPLARAIGAAAALVVSIALFAALSRDSFGFWLERMALSNESWPRLVQLEVVGFPPDPSGVRTHKLAQDDDYELLVHARTAGHKVPDAVEIRYRLADGRRGRDTMIRVGEAQAGRDEFQLFRYEFKRVAGNMTFDVVGGDDRVRDLELRVVERPELHALELEYIYPEYLGRESRRLPVTGGMRVPQGTRLVLHAAATKPLTAARFHRSQNQADVDMSFGAQPTEQLQWDYGVLMVDDVLTIGVTDIDGVAAREPYRISLTAVPDDVPQIAIRLAGIGAAVTPEATIPFVGKVTDDYGLDGLWFEYEVDQKTPGTRDLPSQPNGRQEVKEIGVFDLRGGDEPAAPRSLVLQPGAKLTLTLKASDRFDLNEEPHDGSSPPFSLDVVTSSELLALIERRELALRQRFEAIYEKVRDTRNLLARVEFNVPDENSASESGTGALADDATAEPPAGNSTKRSIARRRLRVAGSQQNIAQSAEEIVGVAEAFDDLHDQLDNNRIDNQDLKSRLREQIAQPLYQIGNQRMPQLSAQVKLVEERVEDADAGQTELTKTLVLADAVLVEMQQVLDRMRELESYNEAVALLRGIISDQDEINRQTKERQLRRFDDLLEE